MNSFSNNLSFIGLGQMGIPLVGKLSEAGYEIHVYDISREALNLVRGMKGVTAAATIDEAVSNADITFTCLPNEEAIKAVYLGDGGVHTCAKSGHVTCDISTATPDLVKHLNENFGKIGGSHFDAPVFGAPLDAEAGQAFFALSGDPDKRAQIEPFMNAMGRGYLYVGASGSASLMKIFQNSLGYGYSIVTAEILSMCQALGADTDQFVRLVNEAKVMGWSKYFDLYAADIVAERASDTGRLHIAAKDTKLLKHIIDQNNFDAPLLEETARLYNQALEQGLGREVFTAVTKLVQEKNIKKT